MAGQAMHNSIRVIVHDFPANSAPLSTLKPLIRHPLELLNGHVAVHSTEEIDIEKIAIHLQGKRLSK